MGKTPHFSSFGLTVPDFFDPRLLDLVVEANIHQVQVNVKWQDIELKPRTYHWNSLDSFILKAVSEGLILYIRLIPACAWANDEEKVPGKKDLPAFCEFVEQFSTRYKGKISGYILDTSIHAWEKQYGSACTITGVLKRADSEAQLILAANEAQEICDCQDDYSAVAFSLNNNSWKNSSQYTRAITDRITHRHVWGLELGYPVTVRSGLSKDGENMREIVYRMISTLANGCEKVFWSQLIDDEKNYSGIFFKESLLRKPSFRAFYTMTRLLWPYEAIEILMEGPDIWAYQFLQPGGQSTTVVWSAFPYVEQTWPIKGKGVCKVYDICGVTANNPQQLPLNAEPLYIIENARNPDMPRVVLPDPEPVWKHRESVNPSAYETFEFTSVSFQGNKPIVKNGWDWSLPSNIQPEEYSGYFNFESEPTGDIRITGWHPDWKDWHVGPGKYDFSSLEQKLENAKAQGFRVGIRLQSVCRACVPDWVIKKYNPPVATLGGRFQLEIVAPWDENVKREFEAFVRELGKRGYHKDPAFAFASIHGISQSLGEEFSLPAEDVIMLEKNTGLTPEKLEGWAKDRIQTWAEAFGEEAYKLAWVGRSREFGTERYNGIAQRLVKHAVNLGVGSRGGFIEMYHYIWNEPERGQTRSKDGYMVIDEDLALRNCKSYSADENEEYVTHKRWRFGLIEDDENRWRMSMLRTLQMRRNFLCISVEARDLIDWQLTEYVRMSMGKTIHNTPDAWCYLREGYVESEGKALSLKNFERWLYQRDIPGGMTRVDNRTDRTWTMITDPKGTQYEYNARSTDHVSGNDYIYFKLYDKLADSDSYLLKVTYIDNSRAKWNIEYNGAKSPYTPTEIVCNEGDDQIKTATFYLPDARFSGGISAGQDFRIYNGGKEDVTVMFVRIIRP